MLPRKHRLKKSSDFKKTYKKGKHLRGKYGKLIVLDRSDSKPAKIGIIIPAKLGNAVHRKRAQRQVREIFRANIEKIPEGANISFILWNINFDFSEIQKDLEQLINEIPDTRNH